MNNNNNYSNMDWSAVASAAIGALGTVGSFLGNAGMTRKQMRYARELANKGMTNDQLQAFELSREAAQEERDWNLQMDSTKYQRNVADMQAAGINPALAMNGGISTQATSNNAPSAQASGPGSALPVPGLDLSQVAEFATLPYEIKNMKEQNKLLAEEARGKGIENEIKNQELKVTPQKLQLMLKDMQATIDQKSETAKQLSVQRKFMKKELKWYDAKSEADLVVKYSQVGLNDAQAKEATAMYNKITTECSWLPKMYAAQIANLAAATGFTSKDTAMMNFKYMKTVTLNDAKSMGINILGKFGINGSTSNDTLVMIVPDENGKWEVIGLSSADVKNREPAVTQDEKDTIQDLQKQGQ